MIYNNYLFKQINPLGFVESWLKTGAKNKEQLIDEMDYIWFKISKLDFKKLNSSTASFSALHLMLVNNFEYLFKKLNDKNYHILMFAFLDVITFEAKAFEGALEQAEQWRDGNIPEKLE